MATPAPFVPPPPDSWQGPAPSASQQSQSTEQPFTPPPPTSWQGPAQNSEKPGFWSELYGNTLKPLADLYHDYAQHTTENTPKYGLLAGFPAAAQTLGDVSGNIRNSFVDAAKKTGAALKQGDIGHAIQQSPGMVPFVGPAAVRIGEQVEQGNIPAALGGTTGLAATLAAPKIPGVIGDAASAVRDFNPLEAVTGINKIPPEQMVMKALRGSVPAGKTNFLPNLSKSMPEIKAVEPQLGKPIESLDDLVGTQTQPGAIQLAKQGLWNQYNQMMASQGQMGKQVDLSPVADAMQNSVSTKTRIENPQIVSKINQTADQYRNNYSIQDVDALLHDTNDELNSYYLKNPAAQRVAAGSNPDTAMLDAQGRALRNSLYEALDNPGGGAAARELMQRYGTLTELEDALYKRKNVALRQAPIDLSQNIAKWQSMGDFGRALSSAADLKFGTAIQNTASGLMKTKVANWIKEQQTTDALLKRAFENYTGQPAPINMPPPITPAGLLGPAPIKMPGAPDPSGPIQGHPGPYMGRGMSPSIGTRTLPAGPRIFNQSGAPDTSGPVPGGPYPNSGISPNYRQLPSPSQVPSQGFATGTTNNLVPIQHPVTGQIEYVPDWMAQNPPPPNLMDKLPPGTHTFKNGAVVRKETNGSSSLVTPPKLDPSEPQIITVGGPTGARMAIAVQKNPVQSYQDFNPVKADTADLHNLQPDKLNSALGSTDWQAQLAQQGYTPEDVVGMVHMWPSAHNPGAMSPGMVYVAPALRRQGIATALYDRLAAETGQRIATGSQRPAGAAFRKAYDARGN